jgi:hypothetical protein
MRRDILFEKNVKYCMLRFELKTELTRGGTQECEHESHEHVNGIYQTKTKTNLQKFIRLYF